MRTFLSMWSYPNVVRDEPQINGAVIGKEIADLLVVFEDDIILFSDKDCRFPSTGNLDVDWGRWYRNAVEKAANQLWGAERHIRSHPERIFIDAKCKIPLPISLPDSTQMRVHRVVVAHGASARCRQALGGSGSLVLMPAIVGKDHQRSRADGGTPFAIGRVSAAKPFVHVLDDTSLDLLLTNLDTVSDFVGYLRKKEAFIGGGRLGMAAGEEALLGLYVAKINENDEHDFVLPRDRGDQPIALNEDRWHSWLASGERRRKLAADEVSYLWDHLIEQFTQHFLAGTSYHLTDAESTHYEFERALRFYARESRLRRRILSRALIEMHANTPPTQRRIRVIPPMRPGDPHWVLLLFPFPEKLTVGRRVGYDHYRSVRREFLNCCLRVVKLLNPDALDIVGFTTESGRRERGSEDAGYLDARGWSNAAQEDARRIQRELGILVKPNMIQVHAAEYPVS